MRATFWLVTVACCGLALEASSFILQPAVGKVRGRGEREQAYDSPPPNALSPSVSHLYGRTCSGCVVMAAGADEREKEAVGAGVGNRRDVLQRAASLATAAALGGLPQAALAKKGKDGCRNIEECREVGERTSERIEQELGPVVKLGQGVRYREVKPPNPPASAEPVPVVKEGDVCYIKYQVLKGNGDFMWSLGYGKEPGLKDADETYRVKLGRTPLPDVPVAVEMALVGMKPGAVRRVEMPPRVGFESSAWEPAPQTFSGRKKLERFRAVLTGNGLQPGFDAVVLFEVELVSVRPPRGPGKGKGAGGAAPEVDAASAFNRLTQTN